MTLDDRAERFQDDVSAAAVSFGAFAVAIIPAWLVLPVSSAQRAASDPLVQLVDATLGLWLIPALCVLLGLGWAWRRPPTRAALARAVRGATAAVVLAGVGLPLLRWLVGPSLPSFVPPEESAAPGLLLGLGAGLLEEAVFRLGLLATSFVLASRVLSTAGAVGISVVLTGLAFALAHELGPGAGPFELHFFLTRFLIPGCGMSLLFFRPGPAFLVFLHASAHVGIALLFAGSPATAG
jgi:hypothetical protein